MKATWKHFKWNWPISQNLTAIWHLSTVSQWLGTNSLKWVYDNKGRHASYILYSQSYFQYFSVLASQQQPCALVLNIYIEMLIPLRRNSKRIEGVYNSWPETFSKADQRDYSLHSSTPMPIADFAESCSRLTKWWTARCDKSLEVDLWSLVVFMLL